MSFCTAAAARNTVSRAADTLQSKPSPPNTNESPSVTMTAGLSLTIPSVLPASIYSAKTTEIAVGDRIQFRAPDHALRVSNGEFATVLVLDENKAVLRADAGREISASLQRLRHVDHGYASTSHSSQGATVDRVIVNVDTLRPVELVNRKQFYVSISRARDGVTIYTDDREALRRVVNRNREKSVALDQDRIRIQPQIKQGAEVQRRTISHHHGIVTVMNRQSEQTVAARRYERVHFGLRKLRRSATPRYARLALRTGPRKVALAALATAPPALSRRPLRLSRLQRSAARISEFSAALQTRLRGRRLQNATHYQKKQSALPLRGSGHMYRSS